MRLPPIRVTVRSALILVALTALWLTLVRSIERAIHSGEAALWKSQESSFARMQQRPDNNIGPNWLRCARKRPSVARP